ncbi:MAG: 5-(carboxyamino)imidazole ribonucleotide mutase [Thermoplasmata archaeon]|nr:MAG: 5-(carboxyamino)imidazole ribonucleotide mutase [Thermoplasmata archaeon]
MDVLIILGSKSDTNVADKAKSVFDELGIDYDINIASAHRTPERVSELVSASDAKVFIAIAGLSAALPGVIASHTLRPVIGVPVSGKLNLDAVLSVLQMPPGVPVGAVGLDNGKNAAILAAEILALGDKEIEAKLIAYRKKMAEKVSSDAKAFKSK